VNGLARCIQFGLVHALTALQRSQVQTIKARGAELFAPDKGGSYEVFNERPLDLTLEHYCMQDVVHMPALWILYNEKLWVRFWKFVVQHETKKRIEESRSPHYVPQGKHKSLGWSWGYLRWLERQWNG
jgi:exonuclease 3'-5' domain-containing protein 1